MLNKGVLLKTLKRSGSEARAYTIGFTMSGVGQQGTLREPFRYVCHPPTAFYNIEYVFVSDIDSMQSTYLRYAASRAQLKRDA